MARHAVGGRVSNVTLTAAREASTHRTTDVDVVRPDGTVVRLLHKDLGAGAVLPEARGHRPTFMSDADREVEVYRHALSGGRFGAPRLLASGTTSSGGPWLLLERVDAVALWQVGEVGVWQDVARWAAGLHAASVPSALAPSLLSYDRTFFARWPPRARQFLRGAGPVAAAGLECALERYDDVIDALGALPATFVHGELYASNVLVAPPRVCAIDWETAGLGPGLLDVAALVAGRWSDADRDLLLGAYHAALPPGSRPALQELRADLLRCRLHLAVQLLGWSAEWRAPSAHEHDWLAAAVECAEQLR
jgi:aminoglycoside phosphotransferase (APT) family kinase protein